MKKTLRNLGILTLLVVMGLGSAIAATKASLVLLTNGSAARKTADGLDPRDSIAYVRLSDYGYVVTVINDTQTNTAGDVDSKAAIDACDAIIISSTANSGKDFGPDSSITKSLKPILCWEYGCWDEMGVATSGGGTNLMDSIVKFNLAADPAIVGTKEVVQFISKTGAVENFLRSPLIPYAKGAITIAQVPSKTAAGKDTLLTSALYADAGAELLPTSKVGSTAPATYIAWGLFDSGTLAWITPAGWQMFYRAVAYLVGEPFVSSPISKESVLKAWYANNSLNLIMDGSSQKSDIKVFDITGRMLIQKQVNGETNVTIPMNNFKSGLYIVKTKGFSGKFVVN